MGLQTALTCFFLFFRLAFETIKSSFLFFLWAETETRKSVYLKSGLGEIFGAKLGLKTALTCFFFFRLGLVGKWDAHVGVRTNPALEKTNQSEKEYLDVLEN